jgi:selenocysteine lyase/cysteine desulfurase
VLRDHFPIFENKVFINSCSKGALSHEVKKAYSDYLNDWQVIGSPWELWVEKQEATRNIFADLINAAPGEVAITTSASTAVSNLTTALDYNQRSKIVVTDFEFPTVPQIWHAQEARGADVVHVPERDGRIPLELIEAAIDENTALVAITHVCYRNGAKQDVDAIVDIAHRKGALVLLDAYQSLGTMPIDVKALGVDFLIGGALKYLLGSSGLAFLYVRQDLVEGLKPTTTGWFAQEDIFALDIYAHVPANSARRFEAGTPSVPNLYAGLAGLEIIRSLGFDRIEAHVRELTAAIKERAHEAGFNLTTPFSPDEHGALIAIKAMQVEELVAKLAEDDIIVSSRDGNLRISPHFYNTLEDVDRLFTGLAKQRKFLMVDMVTL